MAVSCAGQVLFSVVGEELLEGCSRAPDLVGRGAVGDPDIAGAAEVIARHEEQIKFLCPLAEGIGVILERFYEEVERTVRLDALVADFLSMPRSRSLLVR